MQGQHVHNKMNKEHERNTAKEDLVAVLFVWKYFGYRKNVD